MIFPVPPVSWIDGRQKNIFVGSWAPWFEITDELPQSEEYQRKE
jgi:hypothetical protein